MKNAGKARSYGLYRHLRTSKEIIENLLNYSYGKIKELWFLLKQIDNRPVFDYYKCEKGTGFERGIIGRLIGSQAIDCI